MNNELITTILTPDQRAALVQTLQTRSRHGPSEAFSVTVGSHTIFYDPGVDAYRVRVAGPHGDAISDYLRGRALLYRGEPFNAALNWYVFEEAGPETVTFHIIDLASGNVALFQHADIIFSFWYTGTSELVYHDISRLNVDSWFGFDVATGKSRCFFVGGETAYLALNGQYMLVVAASVLFVALVEMSLGKMVARVLPGDFTNLVTNLKELQVLHYDPEISTLYLSLAQAGTEIETVVAIEAKE